MSDEFVPVEWLNAYRNAEPGIRKVVDEALDLLPECTEQDEFEATIATIRMALMSDEGTVEDADAWEKETDDDE